MYMDGDLPEEAIQQDMRHAVSAARCRSPPRLPHLTQEGGLHRAGSVLCDACDAACKLGTAAGSA